MTSIYQRALGSDFARLHPQIQRRFGFSSEDGIASIGRGVMEEVWKGAPVTVPFLYLGTWRRIMFPETGRDIPFTIENYAYRDRFGRETVTWLRTFASRRTRRFDAYMVYSAERGCIVDYLGTHQHLAVDIELRVDEQGGLCLRSGEQRFHEGPLSFRFPMAFSGVANVREWYDDRAACFRIEVDVRNARWGRLFGYRGQFQAEWLDVADAGVPSHARPRREERRE
ncbi:MAG TPA: DUF4166 domain-containing protein [Gemmatimonadaceae bacterium]|nr:DUF4166 domain-containing protein [Gemmatimonadaceae bacterium]